MTKSHMLEFSLEDVTNDPFLWEHTDPVRPHLNVDFKTALGRGVFGLRDREGNFKAFLCWAKTTDVPKNEKELNSFTSAKGKIAVPYTVWSFEKGAGRRIIQMTLDFFRNTQTANRVVTLSPPSEMARVFHLRNKANELYASREFVNFEYTF